MFQRQSALPASLVLPDPYEDSPPDEEAELQVEMMGERVAQAGEAAPYDVQYLDDGSILIDMEGGAAQVPALIGPEADDHDANLAEHMDEHELGAIAEEVIESYEVDLESRAEWRKRKQRGIKLMGVAEETGGGPFEGSSRVVHPMIIEACVQFSSRAIAELWPAEGPAKGKIPGEATEELVAQRDRVVDYLNYQATEEIPEAFWVMDKLLFLLPLDGSVFKKIDPDRTLGRIAHQLVTAEDLVVPYQTESLATAPRYTHRLKFARNDLKKQMRDGAYRRVDLADPGDDMEDDLEHAIDRTEGRERGDRQEDQEDIVLEQHVDWDLAGFEDVDPETGEPSDIGLPYVISVHKDSRKVLAIRRNWRRRDPSKTKRLWFQHYVYMPGLGFYGFGLYHAIGGLARAATGALRALLDAAQFANLPAGFKSKDAKMSGNTDALGPGEWRDTDLTSDDLGKAFYPAPYKEPSATLFQLLGFLEEKAQRFASTTEAMVGDADNKGPVGTTVALIEQGSKVFSAIHKRCHRSQGEELRFQSELNFDVLPADQPYPYFVGGEEHYVIRDDFDGRVDVIPVSDPNIFSQTQRIAQGQGVVALAKEFAGVIDAREAVRRMLEAMRVPDIDGLMPDPTEIPRMGAVEESMAFLYGKPVKVYPDQDHQAHIQVHMAWFRTLPPEGQKMMQGAVFAHLGQHMAWDYRLKIERTLGIQLPPPPDFDAADGKGMRKPGEEIPPEIERQIDAGSAQAAQVIARQHEAEQARKAAEAQDPETATKMAEAGAKAKREDMLAGAKVQRDDKLATAGAQRDDMLAVRDARRDDFRANVAVEEQDLKASADIVRRGALAGVQGGTPRPNAG